MIEKIKNCPCSRGGSAFKLYPDIKEFCQNELHKLEGYSTASQVYYVLKKYGEYKYCRTCGKILGYLSLKNGKDKYCSRECYENPIALKNAKEARDKTNIEKYGSIENANKIAHERAVKTCIKKYGVENTSKLKDNRVKAKNTMIERYGAATTLQSKSLKAKVDKTMIDKYGVISPIKNEKIAAQIKATVQCRYGVDSTLKLPSAIENKKIKNTETLDKIKRTNNIRYGVDFPLQNKQIKEKSVVANKKLNANRIEKLVNEIGFSFIDKYLNDNTLSYDFKCDKCGTVFNKTLQTIFKYGRCPVCNPFTHSNPETEIADFISNFGIETQCGLRNILNGKEIDIFVPDKNVAIEYNGLYWHSESAGKDKCYHLNKLNECANKGIRLIHIFEDEWLYKKNIVKSRIKAIIGLTPYKIQARKCIVKEIDSKLANKFIEKYHIQGKSSSTVNIGLFYKNRLCAVMTFGKPRFTRKYDWELHRYCTLSNFNVIGGASKLLSYFRKNYQGSIITYADKRWSDGNLYRQLGFKELKDSEPEYYYTKGNLRFNRMEFQKHKLKNKLKVFNAELSEKENMITNGYHIIYGCGNKVFEMV